MKLAILLVLNHENEYNTHEEGYSGVSDSGLFGVPMQIDVDCMWSLRGVSNYKPFKHQPHRMVKHTQTNRWQSADELFECVGLFCGDGT